MVMSPGVNTGSRGTLAPAVKSSTGTVLRLTELGETAPRNLTLAGVSGGKPVSVLRKPVINSASAGEAVGLIGTASFPVAGSFAKSVGVGTPVKGLLGSNTASVLE